MYAALQDALGRMKGKRMRRRNSGDDQILGCVVIGLLGIFLMPLVGAYLMSRKDDTTAQIIGGIMLVVGTILWIVIVLTLGSVAPR